MLLKLKVCIRTLSFIHECVVKKLPQYSLSYEFICPLLYLTQFVVRWLYLNTAILLSSFVCVCNCQVRGNPITYNIIYNHISRWQHMRRCMYIHIES